MNLMFSSQTEKITTKFATRMAGNPACLFKPEKHVKEFVAKRDNKTFT